MSARHLFIGLSLTGLIVLAPCQSIAQQSPSTPDSAPAKAAASTDKLSGEGNVVLVRNLIARTRQLQSLRAIQQEALRAAYLYGDGNSPLDLAEILKTADRAQQQFDAAVNLKANAPALEVVQQIKANVAKIRSRIDALEKPTTQSAPTPASEPSAANGNSPQKPDEQQKKANELAATLEPEVSQVRQDLDSQLNRLDRVLRQFDRVNEAVSRLNERTGNLSRSMHLMRNRTQFLTAQAMISNEAALFVDSDGTELYAGNLRSSPQSATFAWNDPSPVRDSSNDARAQPAPPIPVVIKGGIPPLDRVHLGLETIDADIREIEDMVVRLADIERLLADQLADVRKRCEAENGAYQTYLTERATLLTTLESSVKRVETALQDTERALAERDTTLNQFQINKYLVWAVYAMIAVIAGVFLLITFKPEVANLLVKQRLVLEVLSMSFLLLTIIILGTANLIRGEGLAGLLGTIAGYIFVRKAVEHVKGDDNSEEEPPQTPPVHSRR